MIGSIRAGDVVPVPSEEAVYGLKFSECLPPWLATEVFAARYSDPDGVRQIVDEPMRVVAGDW